MKTDRPAGGWPPEARIVMTPQLPPNYYSFSVCLIMGSTVQLWPKKGPTFKNLFYSTDSHL
jgi:hypothetical protein